MGEWRSILCSDNGLFLDQLWDAYQKGHLKEASWVEFFRAFEMEDKTQDSHDKVPLEPERNLEETYRNLGHKVANLDPLNLWVRSPVPGINDEPRTPLKKYLHSIYCGSLGVEFMHLRSAEEILWIQDFLEKRDFCAKPSERIAIFQSLTCANLFENFLAVKFPTIKRFSLEGSEGLVAILESLLRQSACQGLTHGVIGMSHRGRLNVIANVLKYPLLDILALFGGKESLIPSGGDVKYHKGCVTEVMLSEGILNLILIPNASHLESISPVLLGYTRALRRQHPQTLSLIVHGDAAFAAQGVVTESLGLSCLEGYSTGGIIHLIVNNQIGFTASPEEGRSSEYCTDWAKAVGVPVFHVNGDDGDALLKVAHLAFEFWLRFRKDVVVDIVGYRRNGHNETDEPSFTQPKMYRAIKSHASVDKIYGERLNRESILDALEIQRRRKAYDETLQDALNNLELYQASHPVVSYGISLTESTEPVTGVKDLKTIFQGLHKVPESFTIHPKLARFLENQKCMIEGQAPVNWACAESLAIGSLLVGGTSVRLSGQDSQRGTFTQRHSVWRDFHTGATYVPWNHLQQGQAQAEIWNSPLSEFGVLGFEWGYSLADLSTLILWEAQFGDFANGAQVIIDQYLAASEVKWQVNSSLVMLLPHAYEGQGSEHSSGRIERFLQLSAQDNWCVVNCTTPANYFHVLRRQVSRFSGTPSLRKPLIVFTPKSLLRHPKAISQMADMGEGTYFQPVLADSFSPDLVKRVIFCSGKIYYDLLEQRGTVQSVALVRLEQLYPFPGSILRSILQIYLKADIIWCQEEPENQGAWSFVRQNLEALCNQRVRYLGRPASASTATGSHQQHEKEQMALLEAAFDMNWKERV